MSFTHRNRSKLKAIAATVLLLLTSIVVFQNTGAVNTKVLFGAVTMPLALLLGSTFAAGLLVGAVLLNRWNHRNQEK